MIAGPSFLDFAQATLDLHSQRESLIAANVANADTPGYKAVDIDFSRDLQAALTGGPRVGKNMFLRTFPVGLDGNDVSLTAEKTESLANMQAMTAETTFLHQSATDLITALRPNPNGL
jgi:flagellar basal-body rod protein FlgB